MDWLKSNHGVKEEMEFLMDSSASKFSPREVFCAMKTRICLCRGNPYNSGARLGTPTSSAHPQM